MPTPPIPQLVRELTPGQVRMLEFLEHKGMPGLRDACGVAVCSVDDVLSLDALGLVRVDGVFVFIREFGKEALARWKRSHGPLP